MDNGQETLMINFLIDIPAFISLEVQAPTEDREDVKAAILEQLADFNWAINQDIDHFVITSSWPISDQ